ncbi:MAG TPA: tripartite tricarboxylate transporter substrate binding protein [Burkholderiales bacterium]
MRIFIFIGLIFSTAAYAQQFPSKPIRIIVPLAAGGTGDTLARLLGDELARELGATVIVDNRPGSGGVIGTEAVARSLPDGHTLLHTSPSHVLNTALRGKVSYDPLRDFASIARTADTWQLLLAHPDVPAANVKELIALARKQTLNYGSSGNGSATHLNMELFKSLAHVDLVHVPYKGSTQARIDLIAGQVQLGIDGLLPNLPHIRAGRLKALAVTNSRRAPAAPEIPTLAEAGVPGYESDTWYALLAPSGLEKANLEKLRTATERALQSPSLREKFVQQGAEPASGGAAALDALMRDELARWSKVVADAKLHVD